jgi:UDP-N-acetylmuramate: L-alanyl-gamma-D-glutamyl-meso-diaminopimelate ligase
MLKSLKKVHFIAIGGSAMHNLALALHDKGIDVTGSDDEIYGTSYERLKNAGLYPEKIGWYPEKISKNLDAVILGMHAKADNPELKRAQELNLPIFSLPDFIYQNALNKQRIVICGSHGKTTVTSMILHVLKHLNKDFDFLVAAGVSGFDRMVKLSDAPYIIIEGDEYLSSCLDHKPKFLNYHHHIAVITGIAWDHANVFKTKKEYIQQFEKLILQTPRAGSIIYCENDPDLKKILKTELYDVNKIPYTQFPNKIKKGITIIGDSSYSKEINIFGEHNMYNLSAAWHLVQRLGVEMEEFIDAISSFQGAEGRLEKLAESYQTTVYKDFAHSPSKLKATLDAIEKKYSDKKIIAVYELYTYSSLSKNYLSEYKNALDAADEPIIFYNPKISIQKGLDVLENEFIVSSFNNKKVKVFNDKDKLFEYLLTIDPENKVLIFMSSGNFGGLDLKKIANVYTISKEA